MLLVHFSDLPRMLQKKTFCLRACPYEVYPNKRAIGGDKTDHKKKLYQRGNFKRPLWLGRKGSKNWGGGSIRRLRRLTWGDSPLTKFLVLSLPLADVYRVAILGCAIKNVLRGERLALVNPTLVST